MNTESSDTHHPPHTWRFFVYSGIGILAFFVPFTWAGTNTILVDHLVNWITSTLGTGGTHLLALGAIAAGALNQFATGRWRQGPSHVAFALISLAAVVLCAMLTFGFGPSFLFNPDIGPFILDKLVIPVGLLIPVGAVFLGLLVGFGLMEFIGVLVQPIMRPVFRTPGKSAVDAVASFLGSYSLGLLITNRMYRSGSYTAREAAIITSGFSTVSVTFMVVVARTLDLMEHWGAYFILTFIITFLVTAITVWIPPLSRIPADYFPGSEPRPEKTVAGNRLRAAWQEATGELQRADSLGKVLWANFRDGMTMVIQVLPGIMTVGVLGLVLATYTPIFNIAGVVFYPLIRALQLADPWATSGALATDIPLSIVQMIIIWFIRVVLTVIITVPVAHLVL